MIWKVVLSCLTVLFIGCSATNSPLIYMSKQNLGIEASGNPAEVGTLSLTVGFKNTDVAVVPTTVNIPTDGALGTIRGCYQAHHNGASPTECPVPPVVINGQTASSAKLESTNTARHSGNGASLFNPSHFHSDMRRDNLAHNVILGVDPIDSGVDPSSVDPDDTGTGGKQHQSMNDSLSVFGTFDSNTNLGTTTSVSIGKVFSTGVAAQQLTEGIGLKERRMAKAEIEKQKAAFLQARTACITALSAVLATNPTLEQITEVCKN